MKGYLTLAAFFLLLACQTSRAQCASAIAATPQAKNSDWKEARDEVDRRLRDEFPFYVGFYHANSPYAVVLLHSCDNPTEVEAMVQRANSVQSVLDPVVIRRIDPDDFIVGLVQGFKMPARLRERYKRALRLTSTRVRNSTMAKILGEMLPGIRLHSDYPISVNIDWEVQAMLGLNPQDVGKMFDLYPGLEFMPNQP